MSKGKMGKASPHNKATAWQNLPAYKKEDRDWLRNSFNVALRVLEVMEEQGISQAELGRRIGIERQQVHTLLKGQENLTFKTVARLEAALDIKLMTILNGTENTAHIKSVEISNKTVEAKSERIINDWSAKIMSCSEFLVETNDFTEKYQEKYMVYEKII